MEAEAYINDITNTKENRQSTIEDKIDHISSAVEKINHLSSCQRQNS